MKRSIQIVFSFFALAMLGALVWRISLGSWTTLNWGMLAIAFSASLLVFLCFLYVFNYSYALAAMGNSVLIGVLLPTPAGLLVAGVSFLYGLRLLLFCWSRQHSPAWTPRMAHIRATDRALPLPARIPLWLMPSLLYTFHLMAVAYAAAAGRLSVGIVGGALVMLGGVVIEGVADAQKQRAKSRAADRPVTGGLFRRWRHPNYAGEILFQIGLIIVGLSAVSALPDAVSVLLAPLYIIILMVSEAARLDAQQSARYGKDPDWQRWHAASGSLLPRP